MEEHFVPQVVTNIQRSNSEIHGFHCTQTVIGKEAKVVRKLHDSSNISRKVKQSSRVHVP